jgi:aryl-alcohol dehydrogenase-like predicted oxidoreductase
MKYRAFGKTGMLVSEIGFGTWGLGGSYGPVAMNDCLNALSKAEELGCNFVDTASIYGNAEDILGKFLPQRRNRWFLSTKWSIEDDIDQRIDSQLKRLKTDYIDFYQLHNSLFCPDRIESMYELKKAGKVRFIGVSIGTSTSRNIGLMEEEIENTLEKEIDGIQIPISLFSEEPFVCYREKFKEKKIGILARSCLERGFLTDKFSINSKFADNDNRQDFIKKIGLQTIINQVELFRFVSEDVGNMTIGAVLYPLSFPEISCVLLGTKTIREAECNFTISGKQLKKETIEKIKNTQIRYQTRRLTD